MKRLPLRLSFVGAIVAGVFGLQLANNNLQNSYQDMLLQAGVAVILAVSLTIVNGFTGQFSIGHAGFMAVGGYSAGAISYYASLAAWGTKAVGSGTVSRRAPARRSGGPLTGGGWPFARSPLVRGPLA